jgi:hypothetical protein
VQPAIVNSGGLNAGVFALGVKVVAISPASQEAADAEIRKRMVPPGGTLVADAETVTAGLVGAPVPSGDDVGFGAGLVVEDDGLGEEPWWLPAPREGDEATGPPVPLAVGADGLTSVGLDDAAGLDGAAGLDAPDGDGVADADDATARTMLVRPLKMRKKPVARISVAGRTCLDRMERPVDRCRVG